MDNPNPAVSAEIIWDCDHGPENEGYYARLRRRDGTEEDIPLNSETSSDVRAEFARMYPGVGITRCDIGSLARPAKQQAQANATRNYDFYGTDHPSKRFNESVPVTVEGGTDADGITDAGDMALDAAAREEAKRLLEAWPEQSGVTFHPSGQASLKQTVWR